MEATAAAMKTGASTMETTASTTMETTASTTVETAATASAVTAASVLSECWIWQECKTDESSKCDERSAKTECAHNLYLPSNLGAALSSDELI